MSKKKKQTRSPLIRPQPARVSVSPRKSILHVVTPGLHTLLVDFGRPGHRHLGVPVGGAADRFSLAIGNALVGNPVDAPALEMTLAGPTLEVDGDLACVVFGAPFSMTSDRQELQAGKTFTLHAGERLHIGGTPTGMRGYLCIHGGIQGELVLGSRSGLAPLTARMELACLTSVAPTRFMQASFAWNEQPSTLRVIDGLQADWFDIDFFLAQEYQVSPTSNRMGLRLQGKPLHFPSQELLSEPVSPGAVQVTRNGQCVILGVDGQTIGGYPKIAQVVSADADKLGQLRPGESVRFIRVSLEQAENLFRQKRIELDEWVTRLLETSVSG
jgi:5-oxoprolinase (ATP-hydrolysing) subunit C